VNPTILAYRYRHRYAKAIIEYNKALFLRPDDLHVHVARARVFTALGDVSAAIHHFTVALQISMQQQHPDTPRLVTRIAHLHDIRGRMWFDAGLLDGAIPAFERAIKLNAHQEQHTLHLALALHSSGQTVRMAEHQQGGGGCEGMQACFSRA
jgi:tetratricopeptide (TPR) repeat protein